MEYKKTDAPQPDVKEEEGKEEEKNKGDEEEEEEKLGEWCRELCPKSWLTKHVSGKMFLCSLLSKPDVKVYSFVLFSVLEEKQKSDAEEDGGSGSQDEEDRKPTAEVKGANTSSHVSWEYIY